MRASAADMWGRGDASLRMQGRSERLAAQAAREDALKEPMDTRRLLLQNLHQIGGGQAQR